MKVLQITTTVNRGSVGRHAENVGRVLLANNHKSYIAYGRRATESQSHLIKVGGQISTSWHLLQTRLLDRHGLASKNATRRLIKEIQFINPDIIHLRNIHGYYLNYRILFKFLTIINKPVVWTFHDCWPFTGHCSHFERVKCFRWQTLCFECPNLKGYPASFWRDRSTKNYNLKKELFTSLQKLTIITPSAWLANHVKKSFFKEVPIITIPNGIDLSFFRPYTNVSLIEQYGLYNKKVVLGVANVWNKFKGLDDFVSLGKMLPKNYKIILLGLQKEVLGQHRDMIIGIKHTNNTTELAKIYSLADVYVNPTYSDNFPTTNIEALACGTPVVTYKTGGSPEAVDAHTGFVVEKGDVKGLAEAIKTITNKGKLHYAHLCRQRAERFFNKDDRFMDYLRLYESLLK